MACTKGESYPANSWEYWFGYCEEAGYIQKQGHNETCWCQYPYPPTQSCPKGEKYVASTTDIWLGCQELGYSRPLGSDYCVCQSAPGTTPPPGQVYTIKVTVIGNGYVEVYKNGQGIGNTLTYTSFDFAYNDSFKFVAVGSNFTGFCDTSNCEHGRSNTPLEGKITTSGTLFALFGVSPTPTPTPSLTPPLPFTTPPPVTSIDDCTIDPIGLVLCGIFKIAPPPLWPAPTIKQLKQILQPPATTPSPTLAPLGRR